MRNLKRALSLALASVMVLGLMVVGSSAKGYDDVTSEENVEAIEVLQAVGIMTGDENGNFNPTQNVTRNEMAVIMSNLMDFRVATYKGTSPFTDVPEWAEPYVAACYTNGIIAGYNATTFGGSDPVVTSQATLMVLKALGYFQYQQDFGDDWQLATINQANRVDLLVDVDSAVRVPMTRNDVAQLVLNGLEAGTVEADTSSQVNVTVGDAQVSVGGTKYNYVTSSEKYSSAINNRRSTNNDGEYSTGYIVELGEKLYQGDLRKDEDTDDFGRPSNNWVFETKEIGEYAEEADYEWTAKVTAKTLYDAIGRAATDYNWYVTIDGDPFQDGKGQGFANGSLVYNNRNDNDKCFLRWALNDEQKEIVGEQERTGNGAVTQVYVNSTKGSETVHVAVMHRYAAEVLRVDDEDGTITLSDLSESGQARTQDEFEATGFEEDDIVIYTYAQDKIQEVYAAEMMEGDISRVRVNTDADGYGDNFVADGETYSYNHTMKKSDKLVTENVNNSMVGYLDAYGYVAYIDQDAVTYEYAYVLSIGTDGDNYGSSGNISGDTYYARLVLTDGTMLKTQVEVEKQKINGKVDKDETIKYWKGQIVSYSKDSKGVYTLATKKDGSKNVAQVGTMADLKIETNKASFRGVNGTYTINSKTVFIIATPDGNSLDDYNFSVYTGIANVPDIDGNKVDTQLAVTTGNKNGTIAKVVYIEDAETSGENVIFIRADDEAKLVKDSEVGNYYELNAWVEGERTTLRVKEGTSAATDLVRTFADGAGLKLNSHRTIIAAKSITVNTDELVTSVRLYEAVPKGGDTGFILGKGTEETKNEAITLNKTGYGWSDDNLEATQYDNKNASGAFERLRVSSIKDDANDWWLVVLDENMVTGYCLWYVSGQEGVKPDTSTTPSQPGQPSTPTGDVVITFDSSDYDVIGDNPSDFIYVDGVELKQEAFTKVRGTKYSFSVKAGATIEVESASSFTIPGKVWVEDNETVSGTIDADKVLTFKAPSEAMTLLARSGMTTVVETNATWTVNLTAILKDGAKEEPISGVTNIATWDTTNNKINLSVTLPEGYKLAKANGDDAAAISNNDTSGTLTVTPVIGGISGTNLSASGCNLTISGAPTYVWTSAGSHGATISGTSELTLNVTIYVKTETVTRDVVYAGKTVASGSATTLTTDEKNPEALAFTVDASNMETYMADTKVTYTLSGTNKDGTYNVIPTARGEVTGNETGGPGPVYATGDKVTVTVDSVTAGTAVTATAAKGDKLESTLTVAFDPDASSIKLDATAIPAVKISSFNEAVKGKQATVYWKLDGIKTGATTGSNTYTVDDPNKTVTIASADFGAVTVDGTKGVTVTITGVAYAAVGLDDADTDASGLFNVNSTDNLGGKAYDDSVTISSGWADDAIQTTWDAAKNANVNKTALTVTLTYADTFTTANKTATVTIVGGGNSLTVTTTETATTAKTVTFTIDAGALIITPGVTLTTLVVPD